jgi:hypothetical protein
MIGGATEVIRIDDNDEWLSELILVEVKNR